MSGKTRTERKTQKKEPTTEYKINTLENAIDESLSLHVLSFKRDMTTLTIEHIFLIPFLVLFIFLISLAYFKL